MQEEQRRCWEVQEAAETKKWAVAVAVSAVASGDGCGSSTGPEDEGWPDWYGLEVDCEMSGNKTHCAHFYLF